MPISTKRMAILSATIALIAIFFGLHIMGTHADFDSTPFGDKGGFSSGELLMLYNLKISEFNHEVILNEKGIEKEIDTGIYNLRYLALYRYYIIAAIFLIGCAALILIKEKTK